MDDNRKYNCLAGGVATKLPPEESREQGLGPIDPEQESGLFPPLQLAGGWDSHLERSESSIKKLLQ